MEWIAVEDRMPEPFEGVWVMTKGNSDVPIVLGGAIGPFIAAYDEHREMWHAAHNSYTPDEIVCWMPRYRVVP